MKPTFNRFAAALLIGLMASVSLSCTDDADENPEGSAMLTFSTAGQTITLNGGCTWASSPNPSSTTASQVVAFHDADESRQARLHLLSTDFPGSTSTYGFVERNSEDAGHVSLSFTDLNTSGLCQWGTFNGSGNITLTVTGEKVNINLSDIPLNASESNPAPYDVQGRVSGSIEFYKPH